MDMANCLTQDFIFDASLIYIEGRERFLKFQKKVDSSYIIKPFKILPNSDKSIYIVNFSYEILTHNGPQILLPAKATMYLRQDYIKKVVIRFEDVSKAKSIFDQMVYH